MLTRVKINPENIQIHPKLKGACDTAIELSTLKQQDDVELLIGQVLSLKARVYNKGREYRTRYMVRVICVRKVTHQEFKH